jgi:uncharacterized protein (TIGR00106 family)
MAIVDLSVVCLGTGDTSVSAIVALAEKEIRASGLPNKLNPMSTTIEGPLPDIFALVARIHDKLAEAGYGRISTSLKIDDRRDREGPRMNAKLTSVEEKLSGL